MLIKEEIRQLVSAAARKCFPEIELTVQIEYPSDPAHGDYATPVAFEAGKKMKKPPQVCAKEIVDAIDKLASAQREREGQSEVAPKSGATERRPELTNKWISKIQIAGSGFINFSLSPEFTTDFLDHIEKQGAHFGESKSKKGKTVVTDSSHPNVAKPMGVHHLLSAVIGAALNKLFAAVGYRVIRDNYLGDWGTQFGKLIYAYKTWGDSAAVEKNPIPELLKLYVKFHDEAEKNPEIEEAGRAEFKKIEAGDSENRKLWKWVVDLSMREFNAMYKRLGVTFDFIHGESFYENKMQEIIDLGIKKKIFVEGEGGSLIAPFPHEKYPPCLIKKSDGATLYATRDLARTKYWEDTWHPDLMIMVVDTAQTLHFKQFFEVAEMLGLTDALNRHVVFGRMSFPEKKMSTRKGNIILLEDLLDEAEERAYKIVCKKNPNLPEKEKREVARKVGIGAVKYAILSQNRLTDIVFTWDKILSLEGSSAPYLQYVYARAKSILRKMDSAPLNKKKYILKELQELKLARLLPKFPEVIALAAEDYKPNLIANYLFEVASAFNSFYAALPVLKAEEAVRNRRLELVSAVTLVLKNGLKLLGIEAPEKM